MSIAFNQDASRRLPVYLLLDTSSSMQGVKIVGVNNGVIMICQELLGDPRAASTVYISIITFADQAYQSPLIPITQFTPPQFNANPPGISGTALGGALRLLNESLDQDLFINQGDAQKGDYKPIVFVLTDGEPSDHWQTEAQRLANRTVNKAANVIGLGIGPGANIQIIRQFANIALLMQDVTPANLRSFFAWVSGSIMTASRAAGGFAPGAAPQVAQLPPPPNGTIPMP